MEGPPKDRDMIPVNPVMYVQHPLAQQPVQNVYPAPPMQHMLPVQHMVPVQHMLPVWNAHMPGGHADKTHTQDNFAVKKKRSTKRHDLDVQATPELKTRNNEFEIHAIDIDAPGASEFLVGYDQVAIPVRKTVRVPLTRLERTDEAYIERVDHIYISNPTSHILNIQINNLPVNSFLHVARNNEPSDQRARSSEARFSFDRKEGDKRNGVDVPISRTSAACITVPFNFCGAIDEVLERPKKIKNILEPVRHLLAVTSRLKSLDNDKDALGFVHDKQTGSNKRGVYVDLSGHALVEAIKHLKEELLELVPQHREELDALVDTKSGFCPVSSDFETDVTEALRKIADRYNLTKELVLEITFMPAPKTHSSYSVTQPSDHNNRIFIKAAVTYAACYHVPVEK
jgi:hypothetical protein